MFKSSFTSQLPCRLSWFLVEVNEGAKAEYFNLHSIEVTGDCTESYINRKITFTHNRQDLTGIIRLASDDLRAIKRENERLTSIQKSLSLQIDPRTADLWCLVRQITEDCNVLLTVVHCKQLNCIENTDTDRKSFLMKRGETQVPIKLLHIVDSQHQLFEEMACLNQSFTEICMCEEKDFQVEAQGLDNALLLVQYYEDHCNLAYAIIRFADTIYKQENSFPNQIAYISNDNCQSLKQCIILRKSFDLDELKEVLVHIRQTCDSVDFPVLHAELLRGDGPSGS